MTADRESQILDAIAALRADHQIACDEGTHGTPKYAYLYERLDGSLYYRTRFAGSNLGHGHDVGSEAAVPTAGRLRRLKVATARERVRRIDELTKELASL